MNIKKFIEEGLSINGVYLPDVLEIIKEFFGLSKEEAFIYGSKEIDEALAFKLLDRLKNGEPSAYIIGHIGFAGLDVKVNSSVLIPRMETEELVLKITDKYDLSNKKVLDLCTGSGCIGLAIKKRYPSSIVTLSDISKEALDIAKENQMRNSLKEVTFIQSDYLEEINDKYDLVISNPPYIPSNRKTETEYEPKLALFSGEDGCDSYRKIFKRLKGVLAFGGQACLEMEDDEKKRITDILEAYNFYEFEFIKDLSNKDRFVHVWLKK